MVRRPRYMRPYGFSDEEKSAAADIILPRLKMAGRKGATVSELTGSDFPGGYQLNAVFFLLGLQFDGYVIGLISSEGRRYRLTPKYYREFG